MTKDTIAMQKVIAAQDPDNISESVVKATGEAWNAQEIGKRLQEAFAECHTSREFEMVNKAVEAITGLSIQSLIEEEDQEVM